MRLQQYITEKVTKNDLANIERYADELFKAVGINVELTKHFRQRVNDKRNQEEIKPKELTRLFRQSYKRYGKKIPSLGHNAQAVIQDMLTDINMPFVLVWNKKTQEFDLFAKSIMRKKGFKTANPTFVLDQLQLYSSKLQKLNEEYNPDVYPDDKMRGWVQEIERELQLIDKDCKLYKNDEKAKKIRNLLTKVWQQLQDFYKIVGRSKVRHKTWRHTA